MWADAEQQMLPYGAWEGNNALKLTQIMRVIRLKNPVLVLLTALWKALVAKLRKCQMHSIVTNIYVI